MIRTLARSYSRSPRSVASQSRARQLSVGRLVATRDPAQLRDAERHCDLGHRSPLRPGGDEFAAKPRKQPQLEGASHPMVNCPVLVSVRAGAKLMPANFTSAVIHL